MARKSKERKRQKKLLAKKNVQLNRQLKAKKIASQEKYDEWLNLDKSLWTEARKARGE